MSLRRASQVAVELVVLADLMVQGECLVPGAKTPGYIFTPYWVSKSFCS